MTHIEAMKLAIQKMQSAMVAHPNAKPVFIAEGIEALEEALAKQEQGEPVACTECNGVGKVETGIGMMVCDVCHGSGVKYSLKTSQQRTWVGLTDDERLEAAEIDGADEWFWKVCKAIEAKLKEKNNA
jgi:RecJ-like exonuclease